MSRHWRQSGANRRAPELDGKTIQPEGKIRILREADTGKSVVELYREKNISEGTFHRGEKYLDPTATDRNYCFSVPATHPSPFSDIRADILANLVIGNRIPAEAGPQNLSLIPSESISAS